MNYFKKLVAISVLGLVASQVSAGIVTVGNDLTDRAYSDTWNDFNIGLVGQVLPTGTINSWGAYIEEFEGGFDSSIALLVLRNNGGNDWSVIGSDLENVSGTGLNNFAADIDVMLGDVLGIWMSDAKVSFDRSTPETVNWASGGNYQFSSAPTVGTTLTLADGGNTANGQRTYSVQAAVEVPESSSLALLGLGLLGLGFARRQKQS